MIRHLVVRTEDLDPEPAAWLAERCDLVACSHDDPRFPDLLARASGLIVRTYTIVNDAMLARAPRLRVVARAGVGLDNIDLDACRRRNIPVASTPGANTRAVVEFVLASMLDARRPRRTLDAPLDQRAWQSLRKSLEAPRQLADLTLGILGFGRIGSQVARAAAALDIRVIYHDLREIGPVDRHGASPVPFDLLLDSSDILTVHVDGRPANRGLVTRAHFARLRSDVVLINTSRGFVVDPAACAEFLRAHPTAAAHLDVHEPEPVAGDCPLLGLPNARLTPHIAGGTIAAKRAMSWVVRDVWDVLASTVP